MAIVFYTTRAVIIVGLATCRSTTFRPARSTTSILTVIGILLVAANFLKIEAFRHAEATVVSAFRYIF